MGLEELIEERRRSCRNKLRDWKGRNLISEGSYQKLRTFNNKLSRELEASITVGTNLLKDSLIESIDELIHLVRVESPAQTMMKMFSLISGKLGRKNAEIRASAASLSRIIRESSGNSDPNVIGAHYELVGKSLNDLNNRALQAIKLSAEIAESIYEHVKYTIEYIKERSEYLQPPLFTLKVVKGGDCDDLAMLLCSLWESIGYETTLNFMPGHCFPGVKLVIPTRHGKTELFNLKADPSIKQFQMFRLSLDLCSGKKDFSSLPENWRKIFEAQSFTVPPVEYPKYKEVSEAG